MQWRKRRDSLRAILAGSTCVRPAAIYDPISARIAEDLGFELGMLGGSAASLAVLGDPDLVLLTLTELTEQVRRMSRASVLPVLVDADHGYGNALNVRRTVQELETVGAAGLTIEDTLLPRAYGVSEPQLISIEEGVGKMKAACGARSDPALVIMARTGTRSGGSSAGSFDDAIARAKAYERAGVDALFFTALKTRSDLEAVCAATTLPIALSNTEGDLDAVDFLAAHRVRIANQGHAPLYAATRAVYDTLKALRDGVSPKDIKAVASSDLISRISRDAAMKRHGADFLGST